MESHVLQRKFRCLVDGGEMDKYVCCLCEVVLEEEGGGERVDNCWTFFC